MLTKIPVAGLMPMQTPSSTQSGPLVTLSEQLLLHVKKGDTNLTENIMEQLANVSLETMVNELSTDTLKNTFWINVYNAYTQHILTEKPALYKNRKKFFAAKQIPIGGHVFNFDTIEHGILRHSKYKYSLGYFTTWFPSKTEKMLRVQKLDYRIHFALNCGAKACPAVAFYSANALHEQLQKAQDTFIEHFTTINHTAKTIETSMIFSWFRADFGGLSGIKNLISAHYEANLTHYALRFKPYNWDLYLDNYTAL
ncbi:MAG: DUF547 domain-containing protein [Luteibaculaceae bacterium]